MSRTRPSSDWSHFGSEKETLDARMSECASELDSLMRSLSASGRLQRRLDSLAAFGRSNEALKRENDRREAEVRALEEELESLKGKSSSREKSAMSAYGDSKSQREAAYEKLSDAENRLSELWDELENWNQSLEWYENRQSELRSELNDLRNSENRLNFALSVCENGWLER